jgi:hypothetical protein
MTVKTPDADAMVAQVVVTLKDMNAAEICAAVHAQLTRLADRKAFEAASKDASRDALIRLAARTIVQAIRLPSKPPGTSR